MDKKNLEIGLYCGWGIEPNVRNYGDELCFMAGQLLLTYCGASRVIDVRNSSQPVTEHWKLPLVIGGGTVLPTVFEAWVGPGLKFADPIIIFGSGVLSPKELQLKGVNDFDKEPYKKATVIGVRGPLSAEHYREFFNVSVEFIGDLGFAFAGNKTRKNSNGPVTFFLIENNLNSSRTESRQEEIIDVYRGVCNSAYFYPRSKICCLTDNRILDQIIQSKISIFDKVLNICSIEEFMNVIQNSSIVMTERLHPAIIAANLGIPFIYLQTTSKSRDLQALLEGYGLQFETSKRIFLDMGEFSTYTELNQRFANTLFDRSIPVALLGIANEIKNNLYRRASDLINEL